jgi:hypothetical protein
MFHQSTADLLDEWRWPIGGHPRTIGWSSSGDLFYRDVEGRVWRLDTGAGETELFAASREEFVDLLRNPDIEGEFLLRAVVEDFANTHGALAAGECLGFTCLPILGGSYSAGNRYPLSVEEHAGVTGNMHRQLRDVPIDTSVQVKIVP